MGTPDEMERLWELFHRQWSRDVGSPGYDKKAWVELESLILRKEKNSDTRSDASYGGEGRDQQDPHP